MLVVATAKKTFAWLKSPKGRGVAIVLGILLLFGVGYAVGRYAAPTKTVVTTQTKVVTQVKEHVIVKHDVQVKMVAHKVYIRAKAQNTHTVTETTKKPDGTVVTKTTTDTSSSDVTANTEGKKTEAASHTVADKTEEKKQVATKKTKKVVENNRPNWAISPMVGVNLSGLKLTNPVFKPVFGLQVERRIVGPFSVGAWGLSSGQVGVELTVRF